MAADPNKRSVQFFLAFIGLLIYAIPTIFYLCESIFSGIHLHSPYMNCRELARVLFSDALIGLLYLTTLLFFWNLWVLRFSDHKEGDTEKYHWLLVLAIGSCGFLYFIHSVTSVVVLLYLEYLEFNQEKCGRLDDMAQATLVFKWITIFGLEAV